MRLPVVSGIKVVKALGKIGFEVDHQTGSHLIPRENKEPPRRVTVPPKPRSNCPENIAVNNEASRAIKRRIHKPTLKFR